MGIDVELARLEPTLRINLDLSLLIALVSDITHSPLPESPAEAEARYVPPAQYREWKRKRLEACKHTDEEIDEDDGIANFAQAIGFSKECLGFHLGAPQTANLGDGNGSVNQTIEFREDFGNDALGTCLESLIGGNHFRVFRQNGTQANSGALFLAASKEQPASKNHDIVPDGYNIGRDELVANAMGTKSHGGITYNVVAKNITGLMPAGSEGVNHGIAVDAIAPSRNPEKRRDYHCWLFICIHNPSLPEQSAEYCTGSTVRDRTPHTSPIQPAALLEFARRCLDSPRRISSGCTPQRRASVSASRATVPTLSSRSSASFSSTTSSCTDSDIDRHPARHLAYLRAPHHRSYQTMLRSLARHPATPDSCPIPSRSRFAPFSLLGASMTAVVDDAEPVLEMRDWEVVPEDWWKTSFRAISWSYKECKTKPGYPRPPHYHNLLARGRRRRIVLNTARDEEDVDLNEGLSGVRATEAVLKRYEAEVSIVSPDDIPDNDSPVERCLDVLTKEDWDDKVQELLGGILQLGPLPEVDTPPPGVTLWDLSRFENESPPPRSPSTAELTDSETSVESDPPPSTPKPSKTSYARVVSSETATSPTVHSPLPSKLLSAAALTFIPSTPTVQVIREPITPPLTAASNSSGDSPFSSPTYNFHFPSLKSMSPADRRESRSLPPSLQKDESGFYVEVVEDVTAGTTQSLNATRSTTPPRGLVTRRRAR
ncbi:hypothetical protein NUW54_g11361 [Trametes sanguinea]|uniref:Uncharacterized protein n=1 Tax=Trametes sanguinea TaxID=158606 RepID=A0ACC1NG74_9APHY|nr:hypothetical protein NUW54_g11361 [Trametes sanguinea]